MTNNSQKSFLEFLHNKFNMAIVGYAKETLQVQLNKIKDHKIFLVTYTYKNTMNYIHKDKDGKVFISKVNNYTIKDEATGEKKIINVGKSNCLVASPKNKRDLIILDTTNKYNDKFIKELADYEVRELPKRLNIHYNVDMNTIFNDLMGGGTYEK